MTSSMASRSCARLMALFIFVSSVGCAITVSVGDASADGGASVAVDVPTRQPPADAPPSDTPTRPPPSDAGPDRAGPCGGCPVGALCCGGVCANLTTDRANCGACGRSCNDRQYCRAEGGGSACAPAMAPRLIAPLPTATVTSRRPTFRWERRALVGRYWVEVCADRACTSPTTTFLVEGDRGRPPVALPSGRLFWRVRNDALSLRSAVWPIDVGEGSASVDTSWGAATDYNGDGYADLAVGAWRAGFNGEESVGRVHVYYGSAAGLPRSPELTIDGPSGAGSWFGRSVETVGDLNGDGYVDLAVGAPGTRANGIFAAGAVHVYYGSAAGITTVGAQMLAGAAEVSFFGMSIAGVGDVNGDGYGDLAVGAPGTPSDLDRWGVGRVTVFLGGADGVSSSRRIDIPGPEAPDGQLGWTVASAGDVNGDGFADLAASSLGSTSSGAAGPGRVQLHLGSAAGTIVTPAWRVRDPASNQDNYGRSVANIGDVNGDGYADLAVGAPGTGRYAGTAYPGHVEVYFGGASGLPRQASQVFDDGGALHDFGYAVAGLGDLDRDGYADLAVSERSGQLWTVGSLHLFRGGPTGLIAMDATPIVVPFGSPPVRAADVNGDGFLDIALGAPNSNTNREYFSGDVFVWLGSASGFDPMATQTLQGPDGRSSEFGQAVASLGWSRRRRTRGG